MINNKVKGEIKKINSVRGTVYRPEKDWSYSHHPSITFFKGMFYAVWSNGKENEDDLGQRILISRSPDGETWETPKPLITPEMLGDEEKVITASGFHVYDDTLYVYYSVYNYTDEALGGKKTRPRGDDGAHRDTDCGYLETKDGVNFSEPKPLGFGMVINHGPQKTKSGKLIIAGHTVYPVTDDPRGISGYKMRGIFGDAIKFDEDYPVDNSDIADVAKINGWATRLLCEGSFYETDDGVWQMLLRCPDFRLWHTESRDLGETWSDPEPTDFIDDGSKTHAGRLPDGRYYVVSNPVPWSHRIPLNIHLSTDGENFDKHYILRDEPYEQRIEGFGKAGVYGYPHTLVHGDYMYVIYSKHKEDVEVTKFKLSEL